MRKKQINPMMAKAWTAAVQTLAAHNGSLEMVPLTPRGEELPQVRGRVLAVEADGQLMVEKPAGTPQASALVKGVALSLFVVQGQTRLNAESKVLDLGHYRLNAQMRVLAVQLESPRTVVSAQRRTGFRLITAAMNFAPVGMHGGGVPSVPSPLSAQLMDLSDRGAGLVVRLAPDEAKAMVGTVFALTLKMPGEASALVIDGMVVRTYMLDEATQHLGIQFEFESGGQRRRVERVIQQFSADQQRKQLRRMRGAGSF